MTSREIVRDIVQLQRTVAQINDEIPDAGLTLTRTAVQAITTAGTTIVWQSRIRGQGMTWAGANVTIPSDGWYLFSLNFQVSVALNDCVLRIIQAGNNAAWISMIGDVDRTAFTGIATLYCTRSQNIGFNLLPSANVNVNVVAEGQPQQSPILHIVQLTNQAEV
jgi:hypothetical protein